MESTIAYDEKIEEQEEPERVGADEEHKERVEAGEEPGARFTSRRISLYARYPFLPIVGGLVKLYATYKILTAVDRLCNYAGEFIRVQRLEIGIQALKVHYRHGWMSDSNYFPLRNAASHGIKLLSDDLVRTSQ